MSQHVNTSRDVLNFAVISISSDVKISLFEMSDIPTSDRNRLPYYDTSQLFAELTDLPVAEVTASCTHVFINDPSGRGLLDADVFVAVVPKLCCSMYRSLKTNSHQNLYFL
jgi:hypothetical protein